VLRLHLKRQRTQLRQQQTALGQHKRRPPVRRTEAVHVALVDQAAGLKQRTFAPDLTM
jgi:hypothetical protein